MRRLWSGAALLLVAWSAASQAVDLSLPADQQPQAALGNPAPATAAPTASDFTPTPATATAGSDAAHVQVHGALGYGMAVGGKGGAVSATQAAVSVESDSHLTLQIGVQEFSGRR